MGIQEEEERACSPVLSVVTFMGPFEEYPTSGVSTKVFFFSFCSFPDSFCRPNPGSTHSFPLHSTVACAFLINVSLFQLTNNFPESEGTS